MGFVTKGLKELERSLRTAQSTTRAAEARAVKRVATTIAAETARGIARRVKLRIGTIKAEIRTTRQPTPNDPGVTFQVRQKGIPLKEFGARATKRGVTVQVTKTRHLIGTAFIMKGTGHVFARQSKRGTKFPAQPPLVGRLPIQKLFGPSVFSQYRQPEIEEIGRKAWERRLPTELAREIAHALRKAGLT